MEKLEKKVRTFTIVGILLLIAFIAGIPMTVLGATKGITALLVIGIVFIVAGFYVSPIMLVQVAEKRKLKRVIMAVEKQNPKKPKYTNYGISVCRECGHELKRCYDYCPECSQAIQWDKNLEGMEDEEIELKPCPFCGGNAESYTPWTGDAYGYWIRCEECGCETDVYSAQKYAVEAWNERVGEQNE